MKFSLALSLFFALFAALSVVSAPAVYAQSTQSIKLEDIPDEYFEDMDRFHAECKTTSRYSRYYDCDCLSVAYLDKRLEVGLEVDRARILLNLEHNCFDATGAAGHHYNICMDNRNYHEDYVPREIYCECFANHVAKLYNTGNFDTGSEDSMTVQGAAYRRCDDREHLLKLLEEALEAEQE